MIRTAAQRVCRACVAASLRAHSTTQTTTAVSQLAPLAPSHPDVMTISSIPAGEDGVRWRFPADEWMKSMVTQVENGLGQTSTTTLNSAKPITHDLMEEALVHLYNKVESLRLCFQAREGQLWVADMPHRKLDFQSVSGSDLEEQHLLLRDTPFDLQDGPLWKARLMPCPEDSPCNMPEVKAKFPHQCHLILSLHHATNDGMVMMMMPQLLINIIDSLLQGLPVDTQQVGELRDGVEVREEEARIRAALLQDPERLVASLGELVRSRHLPLLMEANGIPAVANPTTLNLPPVLLDNQLIEKFASKCKSLGTTTNAGFTALINMSLVEVVSEAGLERDVYNITSKHPVDCRRLMKNSPNLPLGLHAKPITQCTATPRDVKKHFWQYVKHLDNELRSKLKRNYMCEEAVLEAMMRPKGYSLESSYAHRQQPFCDYLFSNLYSPRTSYLGIGKFVQSTAGANYMGFHNERYALALGVFSFHGQARFQLAFSTAAVSREVAQRCLEKNIALLHDVSGNLD